MSSAVQRCNIASKPLCSGNAAELQRLCSCLAVEVMLQCAAIPLCSACSSVHQFAAIQQRHLSLSSDCHFTVMCCTKIAHRTIKYPCCSGSNVTVLFHGFSPPLIYHLNHLLNHLVVIVIYAGLSVAVELMPYAAMRCRQKAKTVA